MTFKRDSVCRGNEQIILDVLKREGPMTIRDITKVVSGREVGDMGYSQYARTISGVLCKLLRKGNIHHDKVGDERTTYSYRHDLSDKPRPVNAMSEGTHTIRGFTAKVNSDGLIERISKDGAPVRVYIPGEITGRGIRTEVQLPISADRFRKGLRTGRFVTEVLE